MTVTVRQARFPTRTKYGLVAGPGFNTQRVVTGGGFSFKNAQWANPLRRFQIDTANLTFAQWEEVRAFIHAVAFGQLYNFRVRDWTDYQATTESFGTGDGTTAAFQLKKTYTSGAFSYVRTITQPCGGIAGDTAPQIFANAVLVDSGNYAIDYTTGIVTFTTGNEPADTAALTWTGEFDVPCELDDDFVAATFEDFELVNNRSLGMTEVRVA